MCAQEPSFPASVKSQVPAEAAAAAAVWDLLQLSDLQL